MVYDITDDSPPSEENLLGCFTRVTGLGYTVDVEERLNHRLNTTIKMRGKAKFNSLVIEGGLLTTDQDNAWNWGLSNYNSDMAFKNSGRRKLRVDIIHRTGAVVKSCEVIDCWVSEYTPGDLDAMDGKILIQKITIQNNGQRWL